MIEGIELLRQRRWAEYVTVIITASFIPIEVYEVARDVTWIRVAAVAGNIAIVWDLVVRLKGGALRRVVPPHNGAPCPTPTRDHNLGRRPRRVRAGHGRRDRGAPAQARRRRRRAGQNPGLGGAAWDAEGKEDGRGPRTAGSHDAAAGGRRLPVPRGPARRDLAADPRGPRHGRALGRHLSDRAAAQGLKENDDGDGPDPAPAWQPRAPTTTGSPP